MPRTTKVTVSEGVELKCLVCGQNEFVETKAQLNTRGASFFNLDWLNKSARCYVCDACGYIHWFHPDYLS